MAYDFPEILWHYTSFEALECILRERRFRASDVRFMNDSRELLEANRIIDELARQELPGEIAHGDFQITQSLLQYPAVYSVSFSEASDDLSQWRGYASHGNGCALGFRSKLLMKRIHAFGGSPFGYSLVNCIYDEVEQKKILKPLVAALVRSHWYHAIQGDNGISKTSYQADSLEQRLFENESPKDRHWSIEIDRATLSPRVKVKDFSSEKEWRLFGNPDYRGNTLRPSGFHSGGSVLVPHSYLPFSGGPLEEDKDGPPSNHIETETGKLSHLPEILPRVVVGPNKDPDHAIMSLKLLLYRYGYGDTEVTSTKVPLRV